MSTDLTFTELAYAFAWLDGSRPRQQLQQLGDVRRDPSRLGLREQLGR